MLRDSNVTEDYGELINSYLNTGMLDDSLLHTMGKTLGVRYLLFVSLEDFSESSQMGYDIFTGLHPDKEASLQAFCQVFDCASAEVVWEGVGMSKSESTSSLVNTGDIEDHVNVVAQGIINNIFQIEETDD